MKSQDLFQDISEKIQGGVKPKERPGMGRLIRGVSFVSRPYTNPICAEAKRSPQSVQPDGKRAMRYLAWLRRHKFEQLFKGAAEQTTRPTHATVGDRLV